MSPGMLPLLTKTGIWTATRENWGILHPFFGGSPHVPLPHPPAPSQPPTRHRPEAARHLFFSRRAEGVITQACPWFSTRHGAWPGFTIPGMSDVTRILSAIEQGDSHAAGRLLPLVYEELRKLAAEKLAQEKPGQTLQATALVHEAYVRLVDVEKAQHWNSRGHFFAAAAEAMR